jgi:hypothetical protein
MGQDLQKVDNPMHGEVEVSKKPEANEKSKKSLEFNLVEE